MKKQITAFECAPQILEALPRGILLTTKNEDAINTMVIGWGHIGILWGKPMFITYVRDSRYTKELLDKNPEFTVNIPTGKIDPNIIAVCGRQSGRTVNKFEVCGLTPIPAENITVPAIQEFPITLECKVVYKEKQIRSDIPDRFLDRLYIPSDSDSEGDLHTAYYGEIVNSYIIE